MRFSVLKHPPTRLVVSPGRCWVYQNEWKSFRFALFTFLWAPFIVIHIKLKQLLHSSPHPCVPKIILLSIRLRTTTDDLFFSSTSLLVSVPPQSCFFRVIFRFFSRCWLHCRFNFAVLRFVFCEKRRERVGMEEENLILFHLLWHLLSL